MGDKLAGANPSHLADIREGLEIRGDGNRDTGLADALALNVDQDHDPDHVPTTPPPPPPPPPKTRTRTLPSLIGAYQEKRF